MKAVHLIFAGVEAARRDFMQQRFLQMAALIVTSIGRVGSNRSGTLWTPPHFWALSLDRADEYARAGIPMLPVVAGAAATKRQILVYSAMLATVSLLPFALGFTGVLYGAVACGCGAALLHRAISLYTGRTDSEARLARRLFAFSILYLFLLFSGLLVDTMLPG